MFELTFNTSNSVETLKNSSDSSVILSNASVETNSKVGITTAEGVRRTVTSDEFQKYDLKAGEQVDFDHGKRQNKRHRSQGFSASFRATHTTIQNWEGKVKH